MITDPEVDADADYIWARRVDLRIKVLANLLYQQQRQKIMERRDNLIKLFSIVSGTAIFAQLKAGSDFVKYLGALLALLGICSFVFSYSAKGRDAAKRASEWTALNREIDAKGERDYSEADLNEWYAKACEIELGEVAPNESLFLKCYEHACMLTKSDPSIKRDFCQRLWLPRMIP